MSVNKSDVIEDIILFLYRLKIKNYKKVKEMNKNSIFYKNYKQSGFKVHDDEKRICVWCRTTNKFTRGFIEVWDYVWAVDGWKISMTAFHDVDVDCPKYCKILDYMNEKNFVPIIKRVYTERW